MCGLERCSYSRYHSIIVQWQSHFRQSRPLDDSLHKLECSCRISIPPLQRSSVSQMHLTTGQMREQTCIRHRVQQFRGRNTSILANRCIPSLARCVSEGPDDSFRRLGCCLNGKRKTCQLFVPSICLVVTPCTLPVQSQPLLSPSQEKPGRIILTCMLPKCAQFFPKPSCSAVPVP